MKYKKPDLILWEKYYQTIKQIKKNKEITKIAVVGKYVELKVI